MWDRGGGAVGVGRLGKRLLRREELDDGGGCSHLADPKEEHPLDHFGLEFRAILLGHEALREVVLLLAKSSDILTSGRREPLLRNLNEPG